MPEKSEIWMEKYRPNTLEDVIGQDHVTKRLSVYVKSGESGNLLFAGRPGVGKTTAAIAYGKEIFGEFFSDNFSELNASDERGIDVVRNKITSIAGTQPVGDFNYKIIFLDEAEALTTDAQGALKRTMEVFSSNCRFILSCNYSSKIIEAIQSRCAVFRFGSLNFEAIKKIVDIVIKDENIKINKSGYDALFYVSKGDARNAINLLQQASVLGNLVTQEAVYEIASFADPVLIEGIINLALKGKFIEARNKLDDLLIIQGFSGMDIIEQINDVLDTMAIPDMILFQMKDFIGEVDFRLSEGTSDRIQLGALLARFVVIGGVYK
ncbi:replication factor C small subunit [Patescibacteria group bacterium]|nr:replication factor C small subunit [Patescibacteria group bacterium]MBU0847335.1 replication factor C small subunit [Patescibacteria group bacterium]